MPQTNLRDTFTALVHGFTQELLDMRTFFESHVDSPPSYPHLPPVANKLLWLRGFKIHIQVHVIIQLNYCSCSNYIDITNGVDS